MTTNMIYALELTLSELGNIEACFDADYRLEGMITGFLLKVGNRAAILKLNDGPSLLDH
jgi:hypothetical protein